MGLFMDSILILEDYEPYSEIVSLALHKAFPNAQISLASSLAAARDLLPNLHFDLAIIDLNLPDGSGIEVIKQLRVGSPDTFCIVATSSEDDKDLFDSLKAGAHGYLLKEESPDNLFKHLQGVLEGQSPLSPSISRKVIQYIRGQPMPEHAAFSSLSKREAEVLQLIAKGRPRKAIAKELGISLHTTNDHVKAVYKKIGVSSGTEAARFVFDSGIKF